MTDYQYDEADLDFVLPPRKIVARGPVIVGMKRAANSKAWALGRQQRNGFQVRRVVWGKLMARSEQRDGEEIRHAVSPNGHYYEGTWTYFGSTRNVWKDQVVAFTKREIIPA